eukprot:761526-Rhodomonas_salina.1
MESIISWHHRRLVGDWTPGMITVGWREPEGHRVDTTKGQRERINWSRGTCSGSSHGETQ